MFPERSKKVKIASNYSDLTQIFIDLLDFTEDLSQIFGV